MPESDLRYRSIAAPKSWSEMSALAVFADSPRLHATRAAHDARIRDFLLIIGVSNVVGLLVQVLPMANLESVIGYCVSMFPKDGSSQGYPPGVSCRE